MLVETKLGGQIDNVIQRIWHNRWMGKIQKEAQGSSGGILILWDKRIWNGKTVVDGNQCITGKFTSLNDN